MVLSLCENDREKAILVKRDLKWRGYQRTAKI